MTLSSLAFWCLDCYQVIDLDTHGRCPICGSSGVTDAVVGQPFSPLSESEGLFCMKETPCEHQHETC